MEKEHQEKRSEHEQSFLQNQIYQLTSENKSLMQKLQNSEQNIANLLNRTKEQFLVQNLEDQPEYVSKREWDLMNSVKNLQTELDSLRIEKDKYFIKYTELAQDFSPGRTDSDESDLDLLNLKYKNQLQIEQTKARQTAKKLGTTNSSQTGRGKRGAHAGIGRPAQTQLGRGRRQFGRI